MPETSRHDYESLYDPPIAAIGEPGVFRARVWNRVALTLFIGGVGAPSLVIGLLYLTGLFQPRGMSPAENRTGGILCTTVGLVLATGAVVFAAQVVARRGPAVRARREGLEVRLIGPSPAFGVPSAPGPVELAWALLSGRPGRFPMLRVPWAMLSGVSVKGDPLSRDLVVHWRPEPSGRRYWVTLPQSEIAERVGKVAAALLSWAGDGPARESLPSWGADKDILGIEMNPS